MCTRTVRPLIALCLAGLLAGAVPVLGADRTTGTEVEQKVGDAARAIRNYTADQRAEAVKKAKADLDALDERIDRLETRLEQHWDRMDEAARAKASASLRVLRLERIRAAEWYGALKHSSAGAWTQMKEGFSKAYDNLKSAWGEAERQFGPHH